MKKPTLTSLRNKDSFEDRPFGDELKAWIDRHQGFTEIFLDAYCVVDLNDNVVNFNVAFNDLTGLSYRRVLKTANFCKMLKVEGCPGQSPAKKIVSTKKALRIDELGASSKAFPNLRLILGGIPLFAKNGEVMGSLLTIRNVSAEDELQKKYLERKEESITDGLTGLYNKSFTEDSLHRIVKNALRGANCFSVIMMDIDHFKKINDTYGHQTGDFVLAKVAHMLKLEVRDSDIVGRVGGEEFMAILNNSDATGARIFAERFREKIANAEFVFEGNNIPITMSFGTGTFAEKWRKGLEADSSTKLMVQRADKALYTAKNTGRNRTCQYEFLEEDQKKSA